MGRRRSRKRGGIALSLGAGAAVLGVVLAAGTRDEASAAVRRRLRGDDPTIPILLTALDGAPIVGFRASSGWSARDASGRRLAAGGAATHALSVAGGRVVLDGSPLPAGEIVVESADGQPLQAGTRTYRGALRVAAREKPQPALRVTNEVRLEEYLASVVGSEMYASSTPAAALEAQAIAARTYAHWEIGERGRIPLPDSVEAQAYQGAGRETASTRAAVLATRGRILRHDGEVLAAFYHSTCGGRTIDGTHLLHGTAPAPLRGAECGYCEKAKRYRWSVVVDRAGLARLAAELRLGASIRALEAAAPSGDPWSAVRVTGDLATATVPARALRSAVNRVQPTTLPSPFLEAIATDANGIVLRGRGFGHGVGMCQSGAAELARRGASTEAILARYYPGAVLSTAAP